MKTSALIAARRAFAAAVKAYNRIPYENRPAKVEAHKTVCSASLAIVAARAAARIK